MSEREADVLTYDQANRLIQGIIGATTAAYAYDRDGKLVTKTVNGPSKSFLYGIKAFVPKLLI